MPGPFPKKNRIISAFIVIMALLLFSQGYALIFQAYQTPPITNPQKGIVSQFFGITTGSFQSLTAPSPARPVSHLNRLDQMIQRYQVIDRQA